MYFATSALAMTIYKTDNPTSFKHTYILQVSVLGGAKGGTAPPKFSLEPFKNVS